MFVGALSENVPWQQGKVNLSNFCFKTSPIYFKKCHKIEEKNLLMFWSYAPKLRGRGGGGGGGLKTLLLQS